jgi:uncharacterized protein YbaR (Trm112 family)
MPISLGNLKKERLEILKHCGSQGYMLIFYCPSCNELYDIKSIDFWWNVENKLYCGRCGAPRKAAWFFIKDGKPVLLEHQEERGANPNVGEKGKVR